MKCLAIDLGNKRVGIASETNSIAFPKDIIARTELMSYLKKTFSSNPEYTHIIVGLPYDLYGSELGQLKKTKRCIEKLKIIFPTKEVIGHDERFTSFQADRIVSGHRDDIAASFILQSYLDSKT